MSTEYFFRDKKQAQKVSEYKEKIDHLMNSFRLSVKSLIEEYFNEEEVSFDSIELQFPQYEDLYSSDISIGVSRHKESIIYTSKDYRNQEDMEKWYKKNEEKYIIVDEYNRIMTWKELEKVLFTKDRVVWTYFYK